MEGTKKEGKRTNSRKRKKKWIDCLLREHRKDHSYDCLFGTALRARTTSGVAETDRQTDGRNKQTDRQTDRQIVCCWRFEMADAAVTSHDDGPALKLVIKNPYDGNDWAIAVPVARPSTISN